MAARGLEDRSRRPNLRLAFAHDTVLPWAADGGGESKRDYGLRHTVTSAEGDLADRRMFFVDDASWAALQALLDEPATQLAAPIAKLLANESVLERAPD